MPVRVLSDDVDDPEALEEFRAALKVGHDAEGSERHPGQRALEIFMNKRYHVRRMHNLIAWFRSCCPGCRERVRYENFFFFS